MAQALDGFPTSKGEFPLQSVKLPEGTTCAFPTGHVLFRSVPMSAVRFLGTLRLRFSEPFHRKL